MCAGHAIMQGKLVFSQSRRPSCPETLQHDGDSNRSYSRLYANELKWIAELFSLSAYLINLINVKSVVLLPETVTGLDWPFAPTFQTVTV